MRSLEVRKPTKCFLDNHVLNIFFDLVDFRDQPVGLDRAVEKFDRLQRETFSRASVRQ